MPILALARGCECFASCRRPRGEKPEGLDFVNRSRLVVVTDATSKVLELAVHRSSGNKNG